MNNITHGEIAYNAYCASRDWKSVRGEPLPTFDKQSEDLKIAWQKAAEAVIDYYLDQPYTN
jgi:hypothetical protein